MNKTETVMAEFVDAIVKVVIVVAIGVSKFVAALAVIWLVLAALELEL